MTPVSIVIAAAAVAVAIFLTHQSAIAYGCASGIGTDPVELAERGCSVALAATLAGETSDGTPSRPFGYAGYIVSCQMAAAACRSGNPRSVAAVMDWMDSIDFGDGKETWAMLCEQDDAEHPLHECAKSGCASGCERLLQRGASRDYRDSDKRTPLDSVGTWGKDVARILMREGRGGEGRE